MKTDLGSRPRPLKRLLLGRPLATEEAGHQLLRKRIALPVFSSDALSSVAYATEEIMLVLVLAGAAQLRLITPISAAIAALLIIVVVSYRQTIRAYPGGGGAYIVSHENLGVMPGLVAAAALLVDYVLTVSVSIAAGVAALVSAAPGLHRHELVISLVIIAFITLMNLRGIKESGTIFAVPTYAFIILMYVMIVAGAIRCASGCPTASTAELHYKASHTLGLFLLLRAFSSGATALTGVEAISNGVPAFRRPQSKNAAATLGIMGAISVSMFLGISFLARALHVRPITEELIENGMHAKTVVAQIAETIFGHGFLFFLIQAATTLILVLAANTSYQDFPRLASILARDRYLPRQFLNRGDRLVFSNGIIILAALASLLIVIFDADVTRLIQLYVVGVFTSFTLSQSGMVKHWFREKDAGWRRRAVTNGIGALATGMVLIIVTATKFTHGAYVVVAAIPIVVAGFMKINGHYREIANFLRLPESRDRLLATTRTVVLAQDLSSATLRALGYSLSLRSGSINAVHFGERSREFEEEWKRVGARVPLEFSPLHGDLSTSLRKYVRSIEADDTTFVNVVIPETLPKKDRFSMLRQRKFITLKAALLYEPHIAITDVAQPASRIRGVGEMRRPEAPSMNIALVLISAVHNASLRAVAYGQSIQPSDLRAVTFSIDAPETARMMTSWIDSGATIPLEMLESPFREVSRPLIARIRRIRAANPSAIVTVIIPEFVVHKWWHHFLHNQTALRIKSALLFEPGVVVTSVPFSLDRTRNGSPVAD